MGVATLRVHVALRAGDVESAGFWNQLIEDVDIVQLAVADVNEARNVATQTQQRMHLHRRLGRAEGCPWEQRQRQIDRRGIERIGGIGQVHAEGPADIQSAGDADQALRKIGINPCNSRVAFALASVLCETRLRMPMW